MWDEWNLWRQWKHFLDVQANRDKLWLKIELTLKLLLLDGTITEKDAQKIRKRFDEEFPRVKGFTFKPKASKTLVYWTIQ